MANKSEQGRSAKKMKVKITTDMNKINDEAFENVYGGSIRRTARNNTEELEEAAARNQRS